MRVLAIEPYYGGSHRAFLDAWRQRSRHDWTLVTLPPYKWKWRMRHGAVTAAAKVAELEGPWDVVFCSDMLSLAEFRGLALRQVATLPTIAYFHENQLTYPVQVEKERDLHFAITNLTTALAADAVWFNSAFHRDSFLTALQRMLKRMPDYQPFAEVEAIRQRSRVHPQGIHPPGAPRGARRDGPLRILWAARWEFDKNPEAFFAALERLMKRRVDFRVSVLGEQFRRAPEIFTQARESLAERIDHWGFLPRREDYDKALAEADVIVSTADHEFFGVSVVEAIAAGCYPLLPERLSYPELLADVPAELRPRFFYDGRPRRLAERLEELARGLAADEDWLDDAEAARRGVAKFEWQRLAPRLDEALEVSSSSGPTDV
jgi:glycosyltransferase involved in cell wall biosynthesis